MTKLTSEQFTDQVQALCALHAAEATGNADYFAAMIAALGCATGFTIALASQGDAQTGDNMCEGVSQLIITECTHKGPFAKMMRSMGRAE